MKLYEIIYFIYIYFNFQVILTTRVEPELTAPRSRITCFTDLATQAHYDYYIFLRGLCQSPFHYKPFACKLPLPGLLFLFSSST